MSARTKRHAHRTIVGCTLLPTPTPALKKHLRPAARFVLRRATHAQGEPSCRSGVRPLGTGSPLPLCAIWSGQRVAQVGAGMPSCYPSSVLSCARARSVAMCAWCGARVRGESDHRTAPALAALRRPCPRSTPRLRPELPRAGTGRPMAMVRSDTRQRNEFCAWCVIRAHVPTGPVGCKPALLAVSLSSSRPFRLPPALLGAEHRWLWPPQRRREVLVRGSLPVWGRAATTSTDGGTRRAASWWSERRTAASRRR